MRAARKGGTSKHEYQRGRGRRPVHDALRQGQRLVYSAAGRQHALHGHDARFVGGGDAPARLRRGRGAHGEADAAAWGRQREGDGHRGQSHRGKEGQTGKKKRKERDTDAFREGWKEERFTSAHRGQINQTFHRTPHSPIMNPLLNFHFETLGHFCAVCDESGVDKTTASLHRCARWRA
eukprot:scaffold895_cov315-Pinguiococcus_pyrenoidosus.AAC.55